MRKLQLKLSSLYAPFQPLLIKQKNDEEKVEWQVDGKMLSQINDENIWSLQCD